MTTNPRFAAPRAAYVHVPFCRHRCGYCNFTLVAGRDDLIAAYLTALQRELSWLRTPQRVQTLFLGGGTPTHLDDACLRAVLEDVRAWLLPEENGEFTIEANPLDLTPSKIALLRDYGVNRVSLGLQSFDDRQLRMLERDHRRREIERAIDLARCLEAALSFDLIFAVPGQTFRSWQADLAAALRHQPEHLSTYGLTFERGTRFWSRLMHGQLERASEELERQMYEAGIDELTGGGYEHYEISSFARPGSRCRHNQAYWTGRTYFGFGPGAARHIDGRRETNHRSTTTYLKRVLSGRSPVAESEQLDAEASARERLVFGLRLREGVDRDVFRQETGLSLEQLAGRQIEQLASAGLLADDPAGLRLTHEGLLLADAVCARLLA